MKFKFEVSDLFKIPNILCYLRVAMVPWFLFTYFTASEPKDYYFATLIVMISGITDFLDGQIARRCNMITDLGRIIDPIADKLMQFAMLLALTIKVQYMYILVIYLVIKEAVTTFTAFIIIKKYERRLNGAKWYGKVCTAILYVVMLVLVAFPQLDIVIKAVLLMICAAALTLAFVMYMRLYFIMIKDAKAGKENILY